MIDFSLIPLFNDCKATLKETSKDDHDNNISYQSHSMIEAINFDDVKEKYCSCLSLNSFPMSNDALLDTKRGYFEFIEFKAGKIGKGTRKEHEIRKKIYDSLLIYTDLTGETLSDLRQHMEYILVYNEERNNGTVQDEQGKQIDATEVQDSTSQNYIAETFLKLGGNEYIRFGLEIFEKYCFRKVHTYTEQEFENHLNSLFSNAY